MDKEFKREIIMDNYQNPFNRGLIDGDGYYKISTSSDSCIDALDFMLKVQDGIIVDIRFDGEACAISTSSTSILIRKLIGKSVVEARKIIENYQNMINEKEYDETILGELNVYDDVCKQANRKNCALLASDAIKKMLDDNEK